jgi:hypothetical protein
MATVAVGTSLVFVPVGPSGASAAGFFYNRFNCPQVNYGTLDSEDQ